MKTFKLTILLPNNETKEFLVKQLSSYEFDKAFGYYFDFSDVNLNTLEKLTKLMIDQNFFNEFYKILDKYKAYRSDYKIALPLVLLNLQNDDFEFLVEPNLIFISHEFRDNDFVKMDYVTDEFYQFDLIVKKLNEDFIEKIK